MKVSQSGFLFVVVVLFGIVEVSKANLTPELIQSANVEKFLTSKKFQDIEDAIIMKGKDAESLAAKVSIGAIKQTAVASIAAGVPASLVETVLEGILTAVRLVVACGQEAYDAIDAAQNMTSDPNAAAEIIASVMGADEEMVLIAGVPVHDALGSALTKVGGGAIKGLTNAIVSTQRAGTTAIEIMEMASQMAGFGLKAGGRARDEGFRAAKESLAAGSLTVLAHLNSAAASAFDAMQKAVSKKIINKGSLIPGIIESLNTNKTTNNPAALEAISKLKSGLKLSLAGSKKQSAIDSANILAKGLTSTILETADAVAVAKKAFEEAAKLALKDAPAAIASLRKGIKEAQDKIYSGSAEAYLGVGVAGEICGKAAADELIPAVLQIENGRVAAYEELKLAEDTAILALEAGGLAAVQGIFAATQICEAAGNAMYSECVDSGDIAFEVLQKV